MVVVDNVSYVQGPAQPLVIIHHPHFSTRIGLPAYQPVPCLSGSCVGGEGHGSLV